MNKVIGYCGKHPGHNFVNYPLCATERLKRNNSIAPGFHAVEYAGYFVIQPTPFYGDKDILDAEAVGLEKAKEYAECIADLLTKHYYPSKPLYDINTFPADYGKSEAFVNNEQTQYSNTHPEDFCQICKGRNYLWTSDNELFNKVNGSPNGIVCPTCFTKMANEKDIMPFMVDIKSDFFLYKKKLDFYREQTDKVREFIFGKNDIGEPCQPLYDAIVDKLNSQLQEIERLRAILDESITDGVEEIQDIKDRFGRLLIEDSIDWWPNLEAVIKKIIKRAYISGTMIQDTYCNSKFKEKESILDKYATSARAIALHTKEFCNEKLSYPEMIADAVRKMSSELTKTKEKNERLMWLVEGEFKKGFFTETQKDREDMEKQWYSFKHSNEL